MPAIIDNSAARKEAQTRGLPVVDYVIQRFKADEARGGPPRTLLAVCPNSEAVLRAALCAAAAADAPIKFAATLNQVDLDGGYTGWTPEEFVRLAAGHAAQAGCSGPVMIALDHGGPWLKDLQAREAWPLDDCLDALRLSLGAALFAGYDLLHIDPTVDRTLPAGGILEIETVVERTADLIAFVERIRRRHRLPPVGYEVGTEEVHGGLADLAIFERFLKCLRAGLRARGLADVWPIFVVGKVGTDLHTTCFDPAVARRLAAIAGGYGSYIKGHYTDFVDDPRAYPAAGMGAANVGPELTRAEYRALGELSALEGEELAAGRLEAVSGFMETLAETVIGSGRWRKWLLPGESGLSFAELAPDRREWLIETGSRYCWTAPAVETARRKLYANLAGRGVDADRIVLDRIAQVVRGYLEAFNLAGSNAVLADV